MAAFLLYASCVDHVCSHIPRFIAWADAHPGWLRDAASSAAAALSPQSLQRAASGLATAASDPSAWQGAAAAAAAAARAAWDRLVAAASPDWLRTAALALAATVRQRLGGGA